MLLLQQCHPLIHFLRIHCCRPASWAKNFTASDYAVHCGPYTWDGLASELNGPDCSADMSQDFANEMLVIEFLHVDMLSMSHLCQCGA